MEFQSNPATYRRMAEPYPDSESACAAVDAFLVDLAALREKHRIANVYAVASVNVSTDNGESTMLKVYQRGDYFKCVLLLAQCYGEEAERVRELIEAQKSQGARIAARGK